MAEWVECGWCSGAGVVRHDCGDDTCCCLDSVPNVCDECAGDGGWDEDERAAVAQEMEDERTARRGTSGCDGLCDPMCDWCLVSHECPDQCGGGDGCPYEALEREAEARRAAQAGEVKP